MLVITHFMDCSGRRREKHVLLRLLVAKKIAPAVTRGEATEEAHRPPRGKRPHETEINHINESIFLSKTPETLDLSN